jgi:hypothetical protein
MQYRAADDSAHSSAGLPSFASVGCQGSLRDMSGSVAASALRVKCGNSAAGFDQLQVKLPCTAIQRATGLACAVIEVGQASSRCDAAAT